MARRSLVPRPSMRLPSRIRSRTTRSSRAARAAETWSGVNCGSPSSGTNSLEDRSAKFLDRFGPGVFAAGLLQLAELGAVMSLRDELKGRIFGAGGGQDLRLQARLAAQLFDQCR